eukprot:12410633-Alexandrium_andersonii.AAC.1
MLAQPPLPMPFAFSVQCVWVASVRVCWHPALWIACMLLATYVGLLLVVVAVVVVVAMEAMVLRCSWCVLSVRCVCTVALVRALALPMPYRETAAVWAHMASSYMNT